MSTREPHFFDVSRPIVVGELPFKVVQTLMTLVALRAFGHVALRFGRGRLVTRHGSFLDSLLVVFFCGSIPQIHFESGPAFIKRDGVSEEPDMAVRLGKWESAPWQDTHRAHSVPEIECVEDV
jgi:hypothetical protein